MTNRTLKDWLSAYMLHTQHSEAPDHFHFWTGVSTVAGALRRRVWVDMGYFKWYPNFFVFFVAPPGIVAKSTTADIGMSILRDIDYIHFGPASSSWQAFIQMLANTREEYLMPDGTYMPMCAINVVASELGTFLDPHNREQSDVLTDLWDGRTGAWLKIAKTTADDTVANPWINLIGCTTPSWVAANFSDYFTGGGLASRIVFVYAEKKRKLVAYPQRHIPKDFLKQREMLLHDLKVISSLVGEYVLSDEAFNWGEEWYKQHDKGNYPHIPAERFKGYLARKQTHLHKLAMVLAASQRNELVIEKMDLIRAKEKLDEMEKYLPLVFGQMNREQEVMIAADMLDQIRSTGRVSRLVLYREHFFKTISFDTFEKVLRTLQASGLILVTHAEGSVYISPAKTSGDQDARTKPASV